MKRFAIIASVLLVTACSGDAKEALGLRRDGPDEFAVERKPKLEVPPSFKISPPVPGQEPLNAVAPTDKAREALIGTATPADVIDATADKTEGESALLKNAGAATASPDIRAVLRQEYNEEQDKDILDKIESISSDNIDKTLVDPKAEKERLLNNKKENKPVTEGETPSKSVNDGKSVLDKIL